MRLDNENILFKEYIDESAKYLNIKAVYVEKDYYVVLILKQIMKQIPNLVFKGGTSLSKCFHIINRFSEDVDISYIDIQPWQNERRRTNHNVKASIRELGIEIDNQEHIWDCNIFNRYNIPYQSRYNDMVIQNKVVVEMAFQTPCFPYETKTIQSFIGEYLDKIGRHDLVELYNLESFEIRVQSLNRTFVDKVFALSDYYLSNKEEKQSRHIYDLSMIMPHIKLENDMSDLFRKIYEIRKDMKLCYSAHEGIRLEKVFDELIQKKSFKKAYDKSTYPLLYDGKTYTQCEPSLKKISDYLNSKEFQDIYYKDI